MVAAADNNGNNGNNGDHGNGPSRFVATNGNDVIGVSSNTCSDRDTPCRTVQHAVDVSDPGDHIKVAEGTYVEQVKIDKALEIQGAGQDRTIIKPPQTKAFDVNGIHTYVVELTGSAAKVQIEQLTVSGPGAVQGANCGSNPSSLDFGITVDRGATLSLQQAAVRNVFEQPGTGCQVHGTAISIGSGCFSCTPDVGHATLRDVLVANYEKNGVAERGSGSTLDIRDSTVSEMPQPQIASNGIEVVKGAVASIRNNDVTGNECNLAVICTSDPLTGTQASGILMIGAGAGTAAIDNHVSMNDLGIYTNTGMAIANNDTSANRDEGIFIDTGASGGHFNNNTTTGSNDDRTPGSGYGIYVGTGVNGNTFQGDQGFGNGTFDFYDTAGNTNTFKDNECGTASPSRMHWACS
jgi:hypothetical protein